MKEVIDLTYLKTYLRNQPRICVLKKNRSPYTIEYVKDPSDEWFIYIIKVKNTTKEFKSMDIIIGSDLEYSIRYYTQIGFTCT